jgi:hypothetical protein
MPIKIAGQDVNAGLPEDLIVLRPETENEIVIRARAFRDFDEFHALCPIPEPPGRRERSGWVPNPDDPTFKQQMEQHALQRVGWMVLQSLYEIEWSTVDPEKPKTWPNWEDELKDSGFTQVECNLIMALVLDVTGLNEDKMKTARESFLRGQEVGPNDSNSRISERKSSPSGKPVNEEK